MSMIKFRKRLATVEAEIAELKGILDAKESESMMTVTVWDNKSSNGKTIRKYDYSRNGLPDIDTIIALTLGKGALAIKVMCMPPFTNSDVWMWSKDIGQIKGHGGNNGKYLLWGIQPDDPLDKVMTDTDIEAAIKTYLQQKSARDVNVRRNATPGPYEKGALVWLADHQCTGKVDGFNADCYYIILPDGNAIMCYPKDIHLATVIDYVRVVNGVRAVLFEDANGGHCLASEGGLRCFISAGRTDDIIIHALFNDGFVACPENVHKRKMEVPKEEC